MYFEIVKAHILPHRGLLLKEKKCSHGEQILSFKSNPKFEVIQLIPLKSSSSSSSDF